MRPNVSHMKHGEEFARTVTGPLDMTGQIMAYENGDMTSEEMQPFVQSLIDTGLAWSLQGMYGRLAMSYIKAGLCTRPAVRSG